MNGVLLKYIFRHITHLSITGDNPEKSVSTGIGHLSGGIPVTRNIANMDIQYKVGDAPDL